MLHYTTGMSTAGVHVPARLGGLTIPAPLILGGSHAQTGRTASTSPSFAVSVTIDSATGVFEIVSGSRAAGAGVVHLQGLAVNASVARRHDDDVRTSADAADATRRGSIATEVFEAAAAEASRAAAYAAMVNGVDDGANGMWMHPAALDGSLQLGFCVSAAASASARAALVPVGARLYEGPSQLSASGTSMITSVRQCGSSEEAAAASESCHVLGFSAGGFAAHAGIHGGETSPYSDTILHHYSQYTIGANVDILNVMSPVSKSLPFII